MSPLRHSNYPPTKLVAWKCPSCAAENTGPLEQGCTACGAGDPKQIRKIDPTAGQPPTRLQHIDLTPIRDRVAAYVAWRDLMAESIPENRDDALQFAFEAGVDWARAHAAPAGNAPEGGVGGTGRTEAATTGGWSLILSAPNQQDVPEHEQVRDLVDPRAHATIVAALAFYLDNQLGYGAIPGQLTAAECRDLIEKLKEQEPPE